MVTGRVPPVAGMLLLPVAHALGILCITEVSLVGRLGQPSLLRGPLPGLAALWFEAIPLTLGVAVIGKKIPCSASIYDGGRTVSSVPKSKGTSIETHAGPTEEIPSEEDSERRRRKKSFQRMARRKLSRRRSDSRSSVLYLFGFTADTGQGCGQSAVGAAVAARDDHGPEVDR